MSRPLLPALGLLLAWPALAAAQGGPPGWSPWGGPDSPGGMFGGDPSEAIRDPARGVSHDEVWTWLRRRFDLADRDRSGSIEQGEVLTRAEALALFRAADANRDGKVTPEELKPFSEQWFRAHDSNNDGVLTRREATQR
ncbi:MAG: EF-hand domain-containing protein [Paracraurococcus sp.]|jgi:hypothetical protein